MIKTTKSIVSILLCVVMAVTAVSGSFSTSAATEAELRQQIKAADDEINRLKKDKDNQEALLKAIREKIAVIQAQIMECNRQIDATNAKISANKAEIDKKNKEIEQNKLDFKKRIRAIYMSNSDSSVKVLLGADDFANFLQLSQLTASVSARDKAMIEDIVETIEVINAKNAENEKLLKEQISVRESIEARRSEIKAEEDAAEEVYNNISGDKKDAEADKKELERQLEEKENETLKNFGSSSSGVINNVNGFAWPTPGAYSVTSPFGYRWHPVWGDYRLHKGIDISAGYGNRVVAITDGTIVDSCTTCTHNYSGSKSCGCGGGYGNYFTIDHGEVLINGVRRHITATYAHLGSVAVWGGKVKKGQVIGYVGSTGTSTGPHLHFGLTVDGGWKDPLLYIR